MNKYEYLIKMAQRGDEVKTRVYGSDSGRRADIQSILPEGASLSPKRSYIYGNTSLTQSGGQLHLQRPYDPEMESPDRWYYPTDRILANKWWRLFYKYDPMFGTAIDMYSEMPVSALDITLENDTSKEILDLLYLMVEECQFLHRFKQMIAEFLVIGECIPHCFFDDDLGIWTSIAVHNPDLVEIKDAGMVNMEPIISFVPDENLRRLISDTSPESREIRSRLPAEFVAKVMARQKIRLKNTNCSYVPRKMHPYDERGTSLASRMFRIWMVEDAVYNSTIATFRRSASPIKVAKFGNPSTGFIPTPDAQDEFMRQLTVAETDPQAWLAATYAVSFEAWGANDRAVTISREHDVIEKIKLVALGLSKGFMTGEVTFAAVKGGLQVFLRRLLSLRQFWEAVWIQPKFFGPIMRINGFIKASPSELTHNYRMKRTAQELLQAETYIKPRLRWKNSLDSKVDEELLRAYGQLKQFGFPVSKETIGATVGLDWRNEERKSAEEYLESKKIKESTLGPAERYKYDAENKAAKPPGGAGSGAKPPTAEGKPPTGKGSVSAPPGSAEGPGGKGPLDEAVEPMGEGDITTGV